MKVTVLQDHTDFIERMIFSAIDHEIGAPLNITVLNNIKSKMTVTRYRGELVTTGLVHDMLPTLPRGAEYEAAARALATAVEGKVEAWYCVADDAGVEWLTSHPAGPVIRWNGATWWGKLKGIKLPDLEISFHEAYKPRKNRRPSGRKAAEDLDERPTGTGGPGLRRPDMQAL